ncbi:MAG: ShlB/FhaC/HecB family hemolysin secretion/activation protein [Hydrogenophilaceae bacterium]|nr:ShlB/FhaC/HecB family hemolysin secretion/activation protein [Hydrogenophilaceae bacterium]
MPAGVTRFSATKVLAFWLLAAAPAVHAAETVPWPDDKDVTAGGMPVKRPDAAATETPPVADDRFDIQEYVVEGNNVLTALRIEEAVYPHLGEKKTIKDVEAAREALETAYHADGYPTVFVSIPEQEVKSGIVRLRVDEGAVERLRVSGSRYYSLGRIKAATPELTEGNVPYFPEVQKQLIAVMNNPDRRITPVLRPGRTPGKVEVELKVEDKLPLHGNVELNDRYSANTTRSRLNANLHYDNLWQREHSLALGFQVAPQRPEESKVFSATYALPVGGGNYLAAYAVRSESDVAAVGDVNVIGNGNIFGLRYIVPLRMRPGYTHSLTLGVDYKDLGETITLQGADSSSTPISYLPFSVAYDGNLQGERSKSQLTATLNFAVRGLHDDSVECLPGIYVNEFACKRYLGRPDYAYLRLDLKHTHTFESGWGVFGRLSAQAASGPLVSSEQISAGGLDTVRGYTESAAAGDNGLIGGIELRTPSLAKRLSERLDELTLYAFADGASLRVREALPEQTDRFDLLAAGLGLRFKGWGGLSGGFDLAQVFESAGQVQSGDRRAHLMLGYEF